MCINKYSMAGSDKSTGRSPCGTRKMARTTNILNQLPATVLENPISVARRSYQSDCQRIYNLSTRFQYTVASYTPHIPGIKADNVSSVTQVTLANQQTGDRNLIININSESVICQFCCQTSCELLTVLHTLYITCC